MEAPWKIVLLAEVGGGGLSLWGPGGRSNKPNYPLMKCLEVGGILELLRALLPIKKLSNALEAP